MFAYKPILNDVLPGLCRLYERRAQDRIFAVMETPSRAIAEFQARYKEGYCEAPDPAARVAFWNWHLSERAGVEDDSVPSAYLSEMDQGLYGGLLGGEVQFMAHPDTGWISSMVAPILKDWSKLDELRFDRDHPWFGRYLNQLRLFSEGAAGKFGVSHFILIDGLNFVFELVGATQTYLSLYEHTDDVRRAIELAFEINVAVQSAFFENTTGLEGGTCSNMVQWIPGRIVSESVDPFHMTSIDTLEEWGRGPAERIFRQFDGGVVHIHGNGRHLLETVAGFRGLKAIFLGDDRGFPRAFDVLGEIQQRTGDMPLVVQVPYETFAAALNRHELAGGVLYKVAGVPDADEANRLMERVRQYRV
jgi:hypothetical protein